MSAQTKHKMRNMARPYDAISLVADVSLSAQGIRFIEEHLTHENNNQKPGDHPNFRKNALAKRSFSELSESSGGILGAALGIQKLILGMRKSILRMPSHDLSNTKTTILGATPGAILGFDGHPHERFSFPPAFSGAFFQELGWSLAHQK